MSRARLRTPEQERAAYTLLDTYTVAARLGVSRSQVIALIRAGQLEAVNVGVGTRPEYRIDPIALDAFIDRRRVAA